MDVKTVKEQIAESIIFEKYQDKIAPAGKVTDKEIKEYYDQAASNQKKLDKNFHRLKKQVRKSKE